MLAKTEASAGAVHLPASVTLQGSGQAERQVNRFKLLKRQSYGRASFDLLRRRVLLAAWSMQSTGEPDVVEDHRPPAITSQA